MKKIGLCSLLLTSTFLTGCSFNFAGNSNKKSLGSEESSSSESYSIENEYADEIAISIIKIFDEQGYMHVYYSGANPFAYTGHKYSYIKLNGQKAKETNYSEYLNTKGYFDTLPNNPNLNSYTIEWFDSHDSCYLFGVCNNVEQFEKEIINPDNPDDNPGVTYPEGYTSLVWADEFEGSSVDQNKWDYDLGNGNGGWGNGESEYYTKENATVSGENLHITAKKERKDNFDYTSSRMVTRGKYSFTYGYIEARISLPEVVGMWPAFWMLPENNSYGGWPYSGEIDIMEAKGRVTNKSSSALHHTTTGGDHTYETHENTFANKGKLSEYHVYGCKWERETISFYVDGVRHLVIDYSNWQTSASLHNSYAPFDQDFHIILNLAIGGHFDGYNMPPEGFSSCEMLVDYVRVFKK